jgi:N-acyl-D-aspartate/D-glutamate deacylase
VYHGPRPHPRGFGTFPRAIRIGVRELAAVPLETAINRMTALPAARYGLANRGEVAVGRAADLVVFDPDTIADRATYAEPRLPPVGIDEVIVNGIRVVEAGRLTGRIAGRVVSRTSRSQAAVL